MVVLYFRRKIPAFWSVFVIAIRHRVGYTVYAVGKELRQMMRYQARMVTQGSKKYFYILDDETLDIVLLPTKYLKFKTESGRSPSTVKHSAFAICYYLNYLLEKGLELGQVPELPFEEQNLHFVEFLYWTKEGHHRTAKRKEITGNGTCNAYLKDVFRFFLYLTDGGYAPPLRVLSYNQITVANAHGVKRTLRSKSFKGYMKAKERDVRAAEEVEIAEILSACTNTRDQLLLILLGETGFRIGELLGVDYTRDIDYHNHTIQVYFRDDNENEARAKNAEYLDDRLMKASEEFYAKHSKSYGIEKFL